MPSGYYGEGRKGRKSFAARVADYRQAKAEGLSAAQIADRLEVTDRSLQRYRAAANAEPPAPGLEPACSHGQAWWRAALDEPGQEVELEL